MKKSIVTIAVMSIGFFVGSVAFTSCGSKPSEQQEQTETEAPAEMDSTATAYACPMHLEEKGKEGDKCSKCGMALEAIKSEDTTKH